MRCRSVALLVVAVLLGCEHATLPADVREFTPPRLYRQWWALTEACAAQTRSIDDIRWYASAGDQLRSSRGQEVGGYYDTDRSRIVLRGDLTLDGKIVRHEMLHAILGNAQGHPRDAFQRKCGGTVLCEEVCVRDGGAWPAPDPLARSGPPTLLSVRVSTLRDTLLRGDTASIFAGTITATNATGRPLLIALPPSGDAGPPSTFSWSASGRLVSYFFSARVTNPGIVRFAVGETKQYVVDIPSTEFPDDSLFEFSGAFGEVDAAVPVRVTIRP